MPKKLLMKINTICKTFASIPFYILFLLCNQEISAQTSVVTQHNDLGRTGWNNTETILTTKNVNVGSFGKLYSRTVDDQLYAQLLVMKNVAIPDKGNKNIVFAATVNNSVYAFDADSEGITTPYWQVNLTTSGKRPVKNTDMTGACGGGYKDFSGNMGIVGTPVIDSLTNTLYVVARSVNNSGSGFVQYLHALDITTGAERANSPRLITATVIGSGEGSVGGIISFDPQKQNQRCGLLLLNGKVYISYASHCDWRPYHGWILGYDETSLLQTNVYNDTPDGYQGGIWMSGAAPAADSTGNLYVSIGNGTVGDSGNISNTRGRSESAVKLTPFGTGFTTASFFTPNNYPNLEGGDLDFGVAEMMLIPNTALVITACKDGKVFVMNRDSMGGYNAVANKVLQTIDLGTTAYLHSSFAYYKGSLKEYFYAWSENISLKAFPYSKTLNKLDTANIINSPIPGPVGESGAFLSVSSNGSVDSTAVLWTSFAANGNANQSVRPGILYAFDANDVTKVLWNSSQVPTDDPGNYAKFNCPTVANGKVYLATFSNQFVIYGLRGNVVLPLKLLSFNAGLNFAHKVDLKWVITSQMNTSYFIIERSTANNNFEAIDTATAINNGRFTTTYQRIDNYPVNGNDFYRLKIVDFDGHFTYSTFVMVRVNNAKAPLLYPNPGKTIINIMQRTDPVKSIIIYNMMGKALIRLSNKSADNIIKISTANLPKGTYLVEIATSTSVYRDNLLIQ
jgi:hypothetical protein